MICRFGFTMFLIELIITCCIQERYLILPISFQTKTLRKSSREEQTKSSSVDNSSSSSINGIKNNGVVVPRNSMTLFNERTSTNLNKTESPSRSSISSSTRSLHKQEAGKSSPRPSRRITSNYGTCKFYLTSSHI